MSVEGETGEKNSEHTKVVHQTRKSAIKTKFSKKKYFGNVYSFFFFLNFLISLIDINQWSPMNKNFL